MRDSGDERFRCAVSGSQGSAGSPSVKYLTLVLAAALCSACAQLPDEVLPQQSGEIVWRRDAAADAVAARRIDEALAAGVDVERAAQIALLASPDLQAQFETLGIARADYLSAASAPNPVIDWQRRALADGGGATVDWGLTTQLIDLLTLPARRRAAAIELDGARLEAALAVQHLAIEARERHLRALTAARIAELRRQHADLGRLAFEVAGRYRDAGNLKMLDFEQERTSFLHAQQTADDAALEALNARFELARLMGVLEREAPVKLLGAVPALPQGDPPVAASEAEALRARLDVQAARRRVEASVARLGTARATRIVPQLEGGAVRETDASGERSRGPALALELPLFDARTAEVAARHAESRLAMRRAEALALDVRLEVRSAQAALANARRRAELWTKEVVPARAKIVDGTSREFFFMLRGPFDPMRARQEALEAEIESVAALRDYWLARLQLARASGDLSLARFAPAVAETSK
jgi:cobalt-zinc-cadmium efflux system outer membrane protein